MTDGLVERPRVLALGIGNRLLSDDGVGLVLLEKLERECSGPDRDFVDGGTQGLALLGLLSGRQALLLLDAIQLGAEPGSVHVLESLDRRKRLSHGSTSHESNAAELLSAAALTGDLPERVVIVGVEPSDLTTGTSLSEPVRKGLGAALQTAIYWLDSLMQAVSDQPSAIS